MNMNSRLTKFEDEIFALESIIELVYNRELKESANVIFEKYRNEGLTSLSSQKDIDEYIKDAVKKCLKLTSNKYRKQLYNTFSEDGLIYYIYSFFYNLFITELENKINPA